MRRIYAYEYHSERTQYEVYNFLFFLLHTFHFIDPPYINTNCGHYDGYTEGDFKNLLNALEVAEGKFLLTTFKTDVLEEYTKKNGWYQIELRMNSPAKTANMGKKMEKIEVFTSNYPISIE